MLTLSHWSLAQENELITSLKPGTVVTIIADINVPGGDWAVFSEGQLYSCEISGLNKFIKTSPVKKVPYLTNFVTLVCS